MQNKILLVDDNEDALEIMSLYLTGSGFAVVLARDGIEGIEIAQNEHPELVVTDASMPRMDGIDLIKRLRAHPEFDVVPIIIVTGISSEMQQKATEAGADAILIKPVSPSSLTDKIKELLARFPSTEREKSFRPR